MKNQGKFIVLEGLEGAGKTTALTHISEILTAQNIPFITTREPGGTPLAENLRNLFKQQTDELIHANTEVLLLYAARNQLFKNVILPNLQQGNWIISDRFFLSTLAYQGAGAKVDWQFLINLQNEILGQFTPDLTIYLDIEPTTGLIRASKRGELDRIEQNETKYFQAVRAKYLELTLNDAKIKTINANQNLDLVLQNISKIMQNFLQNCKK